MTAIAAVVEDGVVYIGGDCAGVAGYSVSQRLDEKVFIIGEFIIGYTTSFRMAQLIRFKFKPPKQKSGINDFEYMVTVFVEELRKCLEGGGFSHISNNVERGGNFIVGYRGKLYEIGSDFQVAIPMDNFVAVGCGSDLCLGSLNSTKGLDPEKRVRVALEAAAKFSGGVLAPFTILKLEYKTKKCVTKSKKCVKKKRLKKIRYNDDSMYLF